MIQDTRYKIQDTRYKIQDTRYKIATLKDSNLTRYIKYPPNIEATTMAGRMKTRGL
jgi:hypothetical protein